MKSSYFLSYYEDDVIVYSNSGKNPKLPEKYKYHTFYIRKNKHKLKSFYTEKHAEIALRRALGYLNYSYKYNEYKIFYCPICRMWHIISVNNYKYLKTYGKLLD